MGQKATIEMKMRHNTTMKVKMGGKTTMGGRMGGKVAKGSFWRMEGKERLGGRERDWLWQRGGLVRRSLSSKMYN